MTEANDLLVRHQEVDGLNPYELGIVKPALR